MKKMKSKKIISFVLALTLMLGLHVNTTQAAVNGTYSFTITKLDWSPKGGSPVRVGVVHRDYSDEQKYVQYTTMQANKSISVSVTMAGYYKVMVANSSGSTQAVTGQLDFKR